MRHYDSIKRRCNYSPNYVGKVFRKISKDEVKFLWERDRAWELEHPSYFHVARFGFVLSEVFLIKQK